MTDESQSTTGTTEEVTPAPTSIEEPVGPNVPYTVEDADGVERIIQPGSPPWVPAEVEPDPLEVERLELLEEKAEERKAARLKSPTERDEEARKEADEKREEEAKVVREQRKAAAKDDKNAGSASRGRTARR
jgi:hypothetical protein